MKKLIIFLLLTMLLCACGNMQEASVGGEDMGQVEAKPVIYLYPEETTEISVELQYDGTLGCTYPAYDGGWTVTAVPEGTLTDETGRDYNYLYWEGVRDADYDFSRGFCVAGADSAEFLEWALEAQGLSRREANEFIVYWLPVMELSPYNLVAFQHEDYTDHAVLAVDPQPDSVIRVFMAMRPLEAPVEVPPQQLTAVQRTGFTLVEWGGAVEAAAERGAVLSGRGLLPLPIFCSLWYSRERYYMERRIRLYGS